MQSMTPEELLTKIRNGRYGDRDFTQPMFKVISVTDGCDPMYHEFFGDYYEETLNHAGKLTEYIVEFKSDKREKATLQESFRLTHTIKGASATMGFMTIAVVAEGLESLFRSVKDGEFALEGDMIEIIEDSIAWIGLRLEEIKLEIPTPEA